MKSYTEEIWMNVPTRMDAAALPDLLPHLDIVEGINARGDIADHDRRDALFVAAKGDKFVAEEIVRRDAAQDRVLDRWERRGDSRHSERAPQR